MNRSFFLVFLIYAFNLYNLVPSSLATPIIGGVLNEPLSFKHHVSLHRKISRSSNEYEYFCGGSLVSIRYVLTAARCFLTYEAVVETNLIERRPMIIAGTNRRNGPGLQQFIVRVYIPNDFIPDGSGRKGKGDISVAELNNSWVLSQIIGIVSMLRMFDLNPVNDFGKYGLFAGFGVMSTTLPTYYAEKLHYLLVYLHIWSNCPGDGSIICASNPGPQVKTACYGDRGSVLVVDGKFVGVLSYGPPNCDTNEDPIVFTRIKTFRNFIDRAMDPFGYHSDMHVLHGSGEGSSSGSEHVNHPLYPSPSRRT